MKKIIDWLVYSSKDPAKFSLTLKSAIPFILFLSAFLKLDIMEGDLDKVIEGIVAVIMGVSLIYGFGRKVYNSVVVR